MATESSLTRGHAAYPHLREDDETGHFYVSGYDGIIEALGTTLVVVSDDDYQGDTRAVYRCGDRYGYLRFGWGSCSGCDSLQACKSLEDLERSIFWHVGKEAFVSWLVARHWGETEGYRGDIEIGRACAARGAGNGNDSEEDGP